MPHADGGGLLLIASLTARLSSAEAGHFQNPRFGDSKRKKLWTARCKPTAFSFIKKCIVRLGEIAL
jgi:hypothetical protein